MTVSKPNGQGIVGAGFEMTGSSMNRTVFVPGSPVSAGLSYWHSGSRTRRKGLSRRQKPGGGGGGGGLGLDKVVSHGPISMAHLVCAHLPQEAGSALRTVGVG